MKKIIILSSIIILLFNCSKPKFNRNKLREHMWKYGNGYFINDFLFFNNIKLLSTNDTIYSKGIPEAIIIKLNTKLDGSNSITIKSLKSNELGVYHQK